MYRLWRRRADPAARERRRRVRVNATGRIVDGTIIDIQQTEEGQPASTTRLVFYEYSVRGVDYSTAQDVSALNEAVEGDLSRCLGSVHVKYEARNPSNSIVICEEWSGLLNPSGSAAGGLSPLPKDSSEAAT